MTASTRAVDVPGGRLAVTSWRGRGATAVAFHGFTQRAASLAGLARGRTVVAPDLPGHGDSVLDRIDMTGALAALGGLVEAAQPDVVAGYSMGGRLALHLALALPEAVPTLLLVSTGLGIRSDEERAERAAADAALAAAIVAEGAEAFVDRWVDHPIAGTWRLAPPAREADRATRRGHDSQRLAAALVGLGPAGHEPLHERLTELTMPVVWMAGAEDHTYVEIARFAAAAAGGEAVVVPGCGHSLVVEAPDRVGEQIDRLGTARR